MSRRFIQKSIKSSSAALSRLIVGIRVNFFYDKSLVLNIVLSLPVVSGSKFTSISIVDVKKRQTATILTEMSALPGSSHTTEYDILPTKSRPGFSVSLPDFQFIGQTWSPCSQIN